MKPTICFVTGASGLLGSRVIAEMLADPRVERVYALSRSPRPSSARVVHLVGDLRCDGLGLPRETRERLAREVTTVIHSAADTSFSQTLEAARATNTEGTRRTLELTADWARVERWTYVSTAFVAGLRTGRISESDAPASEWANAYEQSKAEAEALVRGARHDWCIARSSTVVCDDLHGGITQLNAVHRALRLYFGGLAAMLPGATDSTVDVVTTEFAARGIARIALSGDTALRAFHLCAGDGAMPLQDLLDISHEAFAQAPAWRRKGVARPVLTDLTTYRIFEEAIESAGSERVKQAMRSLGHFVPQLAYSKRFDTSGAETVLGERAPSVATFWRAMVDSLVGAPASREVA